MKPSAILAMGNSPGSTNAIVGTGTASLVAVGTTATDALQLSTSMNRITTSSASTGVKLWPTEMGGECWIRNDSGQTVAVYPFNTSSTINAGAASYNVATAKTAVFKADSATTWMAITTA